MQSRLSALFQWTSVICLIGLGILAVVWVQQYRSTLALPSPVPTVAPSVTPTAEDVNLPELGLRENLSTLTRDALLHTDRPEKPRFTVVHYVVEKGDTAWSIANKFGIKPETLLWGNAGLNSSAGALRVGATINILPVDGVLHTVREGETLQSLSEAYNVSIQKISTFPGNDLPENSSDRLPAGKQVIIPGGKRPVVWQEPSGPSIDTAKVGKATASVPGSLASLYKGIFSWPVSPVIVTQPYWSGHNGIDMGTQFRQPIFAAAGGTVVFSDWDTTGFGNLVIVDHGAGILTYYGHNQANLVRAGQVVKRGQQIAESGSTGNSTGFHVDFRVKVEGIGFVNPGDYLQ